eukprot:1791506-Rhodomonas_salina.2
MAILTNSMSGTSRTLRTCRSKAFIEASQSRVGLHQALLLTVRTSRSGAPQCNVVMTRVGVEGEGSLLLGFKVSSEGSSKLSAKPPKLLG